MQTKKRILICDDDATDIKLFKKYIGADKLQNFEFIEFDNGSDLLRALKAKSLEIDIVFLDYYLGSQNGLDILREIRKKNLVPVVMLTGRGDEEIAVECMKNGAMDYIPKHVLPEIDIVKTLLNAIEKWEIERERNQLLGIAAHELRNPIATIRGYTEMLQMYDDLDQVQINEIYNVIIERSDHLLNIIKNLLDITRIEKGIIVLKKIEIDVVSLVQKQVQDYQFLGKKKKIQIDFRTNLEKFEFRIDKDRIEEVISNLLDNAIKYSPMDSKLEVALSQTENKIKILIKDQGLGIKQDELKYLFELFSSKKISTLPTGGESRTGIGLAICKKVIDAHGGEILVESEEGKGSTFSIVLPTNLE